MSIIKDFVDGFKELGAHRLFGLLTVLAAVFAPAILTIYWWEPALFLSLSTQKILIVAGSTGALTCVLISPAVAEHIGHAKKWSSGEVVLVIAGVALSIQFLAIILNWLAGALVIYVAATPPRFLSFASFSALSLFASAFCSLWLGVSRNFRAT